ncbi:MAG: gfo/Idh/MocA family oxidoreductase, partial [Opitutaceae bacterium]
GMLEYAGKIAAGLAKPGDLSAVPVEQIPLERGEPLRIELASFVDSVRLAREPKVGAGLGKSALEVALTITEQIRRAAG